MSAFSNRLISERKKRGLSQEDLAAKSGVSQQAISMIESGKRSPTETTMSMLANGLGCTVAFLLDDPEPEKAADQEDGGGVETEMLNLFRQLSPEKKEYVRGILEGLSAAHKQ